MKKNRGEDILRSKGETLAVKMTIITGKEKHKESLMNRKINLVNLKDKVMMKEIKRILETNRN